MEAQTYNYKVVRQFAVMTVVWGGGGYAGRRDCCCPVVFTLTQSV